MSALIMQRLAQQRAAAARAREKKQKMKSEEIKLKAEVKKVKKMAGKGGGWESVPLLLLFGTQKGTAKEICSILEEEVKDNGHSDVRCMSMKDYMHQFHHLPNEKVVIIVISTTGQGDPPNNAEDFWRNIRLKKETDWLKDTHYAVLGLGDTNYADFCAMGKFFDTSFRRLGAMRFYDTGLADDATGLDEVVEPWREGILPVLKSLCESISNNLGGKKAVLPKAIAPPSLSLTVPKDSKILILIAESDNMASEQATPLAEEMKKRGYRSVQILGMRDFAKQDKTLSSLPVNNLLVAIISTISRGEIPLRESKLQRILRKKARTSEDWLSEKNTKLKIIVLGLGNSEEDDFCGGVKEMTGTLESLGATSHPLYLTCIDKDDAKEKGEKWRTKVLAAISDAPKSATKPKQKVGIKRKSCKLEVEIKSSKTSSHLTYTEGLAARLQSHTVERERKGLSPDAPFRATVTGAEMLTTGKSSSRHVMHLELSLPIGESRAQDSAPVYLPGDSVGVYCPNDVKEVGKLLGLLKLNPDDTITSLKRKDANSSGDRALSHVFLPCTVRDLFLYCLDITSPPPKSVLRALAAHTKDESEKKALTAYCTPTKESKKLYNNQILGCRPPLTEILEKFPSIEISLAYLIQLLPPLSPRYYSVSSAPNVHPSDLHVAFSLVRYETKTLDGKKVERKGLCTNWLLEETSARGLIKNNYLKSQKLESVCKGDSLILPVFIRRGGDFSYPSDIHKPVVMVGPGTGVSPFRGFLHYRRFQSSALTSGGVSVGPWRGIDMHILEDLEEDEDEDLERAAYSHQVTPIRKDNHEEHDVGDAVLFYGCQNRNVDFLYADDLKSFEKDGTLSGLYVAFSREQEEKVYVQHLMEKEKIKLYDMVVKKDGFFFVCGDGVKMAVDVRNAFENILCSEGGLTSKEAKFYVNKMMKEKRYVQDVWS